MKNTALLIIGLTLIPFSAFCNDQKYISYLVKEPNSQLCHLKTVKVSSDVPAKIGKELDDRKVTCSDDSEITSTGDVIYVTSGSNGNEVWGSQLKTKGISYLSIIAPTKITASSSGHVVAISNKGKTLTLIYQSRLDPNGNWLADFYHDIIAKDGAVFTDVDIDRLQGIIYAMEKLPNGSSRIELFSIYSAYEGEYSGVEYRNGTKKALVTMDALSTSKLSNQMPSEGSAAYLFKNLNSAKIKTNNGLTGIFTNAGLPFLMEVEDIAEAAQINIFDPFKISSNEKNKFLMPIGSKFKDLIIRKDFMNMISDNSIYTIPTKSDNNILPWVTKLDYLGQLNTIEMSIDQKQVVVTGANGLDTGYFVGNNLIFPSVKEAKPSILETGILHAVFR